MPRLIYTVARCTLHVARCLLSLVTTCHTVVSCLSVASCFCDNKHDRLLARLAVNWFRLAVALQSVPQFAREILVGLLHAFPPQCTANKGSSLFKALALSLSRRLCLGVVSLRSGGEFGLWGGFVFILPVCLRFSFVFPPSAGVFLGSLSLSLRNHLICWSRGASLPHPK